LEKQPLSNFEGLTFECFNMQKDKLDFLHQILSIETVKVQWNLFPKKINNQNYCVPLVIFQKYQNKGNCFK
jgi:hypothetical protein